jgi:ABC-type amino acid transport system permease subunit
MLEARTKVNLYVAEIFCTFFVQKQRFPPCLIYIFFFCFGFSDKSVGKPAFEVQVHGVSHGTVDIAVTVGANAAYIISITTKADVDGHCDRVEKGGGESQDFGN